MAYQINQFGEINRDLPVNNQSGKTPDQDLYDEYKQLVYDLSHPERFDAAIANFKKRND